MKVNSSSKLDPTFSWLIVKPPKNKALCHLEKWCELRKNLHHPKTLILGGQKRGFTNPPKGGFCKTSQKLRVKKAQ